MSGQWTFLSHHGHVLVLLARTPDATIDNLATEVGITSRSVVSVLKDLHDDGYISKKKMGRRNHYDINSEAPLRHPTNDHHTVGELIRTLGAMNS
jgi:predicted ArsR family transcriptional regulator